MSLGFLDLFTPDQYLLTISSFSDHFAWAFRWASLYLFRSRCSSSFSRITLFCHLSVDESMSGALDVQLMSFCNCLIFWFIFARWDFAVCCASEVILVLNVSHRVCGFLVLVQISTVLFSISVWSDKPYFSIFSNRVSSDSVPSGHVHLPFPMCGASCGAKRTWTMLWSVGIGLRYVFQSITLSLCEFDIYILSRRDRELVLLLNVRNHIIGCECLHVSCILKSFLKFHRASTACSLSGLDGALSRGSLVTLKSPIIKSRVLSPFCSHFVLTVSQKHWCSEWLLGA